MDTDDPHQTFEYRVVPAPRKGEKAKGVRTGEGRFALAMSRLFNRMGAEGWEYVRADTLPAEERVGLTGKEIRYHALLVFRRATAPVVQIAPQPQIAAPAPQMMLQHPDWAGFDPVNDSDEGTGDAQVIDLLAARKTHAAE